MSLTTVYHSVLPFNNVAGCPILTNSAAGTDCTSGVNNGVLAIPSGGDLTASPYNYLPQYPLLLKLFFTNVILDGTVAYPNPQFDVNVSGSTPFSCQRIDDKNFALSLKVQNWDERCLDTTVTINPVPPLTQVRMNCLAGLALDTQDSPEVF